MAAAAAAGAQAAKKKKKRGRPQRGAAVAGVAAASRAEVEEGKELIAPPAMKRPKRAFIWSFFRPNPKDPSIFTCRLCAATDTTHKAGVTSVLIGLTDGIPLDKQLAQSHDQIP